MARKPLGKLRKGATAPRHAVPAAQQPSDDEGDAEEPIGGDGDADSISGGSGSSGVPEDDDFVGAAGDDGDDEEDESDDDDGEEDEEEEGGDDEEGADAREAREAERYQRKLNRAAELELRDDAKRDRKASMDSDEDEGEESEDEIRDLKKPLPIAKMRQRIAYVLQVLGNFSELAKGYSRSEYMDVLLSDLRSVYDYSEWLLDRFARMFPPAELVQFLDANDTPRPETIRANTLKVKRRDLAQSLIKRGINVDPLEKWSKEGLVVYESSVALGGTPEYLAGQYMLQAAASLLPVIALNPQEGERVLDMAAAPGGKTTHICQLMRNSGAVFANDVSKERLRALSANVHRMGCSNVIITNFNGRELPRTVRNMDRVLLDAPCTGTGIISKDPKIKMTKTLDDLRDCSRVQKELLLAAIDSCNAKSPDNFIVYSTCSVLYEENEGVVDYVLKRRHVRLVDAGLPFGRPGFVKIAKCRFQPAMALCRRFYPHIHNLDGFFVAKLQKYAEGPKEGKYKSPKPVVQRPTPKAQKLKGRAKGEKAEKAPKLRPPPPNRRLTREERDAQLAAAAAAKAEAERELKSRVHKGILRRRKRSQGDEPAANGKGPKRRRKAEGKGEASGAPGGRPSAPEAHGPSPRRVGFDPDIGSFQRAVDSHDAASGARPRKTRREKLRR